MERKGLKKDQKGINASPLRLTSMIDPVFLSGYSRIRRAFRRVPGCVKVSKCGIGSIVLILNNIEIADGKTRLNLNSVIG